MSACHYFSKYFSQRKARGIKSKDGQFQLLRSFLIWHNESQPRNSSKIKITKFLATLSLDTRTLFRFLKQWRQGFYTQEERRLIKAVVRDSNFPLHTIPSLKVRRLCRD